MLWYIWFFHSAEMDTHIYALGIYSVLITIGFLALYLRRNKLRR